MCRPPLPPPCSCSPCAPQHRNTCWESCLLLWNMAQRPSDGSPWPPEVCRWVMWKRTHFYSPGPALSVTSNFFITCISVQGQSGHKQSQQPGVWVDFKSGAEEGLFVTPRGSLHLRALFPNWFQFCFLFLAARTGCLEGVRVAPDEGWSRLLDGGRGPLLGLRGSET